MTSNICRFEEPLSMPSEIRRITPNPYALISAARNEEEHIGKTLESVVRQTVTPVRWVIVSDNSDDRTDEIVEEYARRHPWIVLVRSGERRERTFASKVRALELAMVHLDGASYDYIGNLDADLSLEPDYFETLINRLDGDPKLGVTGGLIHDFLDERWIPSYINTGWSVAGAVQFFRRECFEEIGGYLPLELGGIDAIAEARARMMGWKVATIPELAVKHYKYMGTKTAKGLLAARFKQGMMEYSHGNHPVFEIAKCFFRIPERPFLLGSLWRFAGYNWAYWKGCERAVPGDVQAFLRREQLFRLARMVIPKFP